MIRLDVERGIGERPIVVAWPDAELSDDFGEIAVVGDGNHRGQERLISHNRCRKTQKYVLAPVHRQSVTPAAAQGEQAGEPPGKASAVYAACAAGTAQCGRPWFPGHRSG